MYMRQEARQQGSGVKQHTKLSSWITLLPSLESQNM